MKQIAIGQLKHEVSLANLKLWMPFEVTSDNEVIAVVSKFEAINDVTLANKGKTTLSKAKHDVTQADKADFKKSLCRHGLIYCSICK